MTYNEIRAVSDAAAAALDILNAAWAYYIPEEAPQTDEQPAYFEHLEAA